LLIKTEKNQPWIIAYGHRPFYCSNTDGDDCTTSKSITRAGLEQLFFENGVDIIFEAHEHSYERLWPVYNETVSQYNYTNPLAPVHLISGAAGCNENDGYCINPIRGPKGPWSAFSSSGKTTYGYGHLEIMNSTHIYWEEILAEQNDTVLDSIWIIQENHGPFDASKLPEYSPPTDLAPPQVGPPPPPSWNVELFDDSADDFNGKSSLFLADNGNQ